MFVLSVPAIGATRHTTNAICGIYATQTGSDSELRPAPLLSLLPYQLTIIK